MTALRIAVQFSVVTALVLGFGLLSGHGFADEIRSWSDDTGDFVFEGAFKGIEGDTAVFVSRERKLLRVPLGKLGRAQRQYLIDIAEMQSAGLNPKVRADIAPAAKGSGRVSVGEEAAEAALQPQQSSSEGTPQSSAGQEEPPPSRTWSPKSGQPFAAHVLRQEYSKERKSLCLVFQLSDGATKTVPISELPLDQKDVAVSDLKTVRQAKEARSVASHGTAGGTMNGPSPSLRQQQSSASDAANSGLAGAFGAMAQALQATNAAQAEGRSGDRDSAQPRRQPEDPKLSYDGQYPKSSFRLRLEECENKTDVDSLQLWRTLRLKLANSGLSLNEMDWAEHHFRNKIPTEGFTEIQRIQYRRFLELTAEGY